ncbi:HalOD1 output domain-containing protein [Salinibaculum salinum]|uniref:HalOD1 output domain-containing protein n=1 Tax=Salinibaculum salinum TaxID=3131996 RepID=UPI0030EF888C
MSSTVVSRSEQTDCESLCEEIVSAVARAEGVDPLAVSPQLYDVVDPDSLEQLFEHSSTATDVTVSFTYGDWCVEIDNGNVSVTDNTEAARDAPVRRV